MFDHAVLDYLQLICSLVGPTATLIFGVFGALKETHKEKVGKGGKKIKIRTFWFWFSILGMAVSFAINNTAVILAQAIKEREKVERGVERDSLQKIANSLQAKENSFRDSTITKLYELNFPLFPLTIKGQVSISFDQLEKEHQDSLKQMLNLLYAQKQSMKNMELLVFQSKADFRIREHQHTFDTPPENNAPQAFIDIENYVFYRLFPRIDFYFYNAIDVSEDQANLYFILEDVSLMYSISFNEKQIEFYFKSTVDPSRIHSDNSIVSLYDCKWWRIYYETSISERRGFHFTYVEFISGERMASTFVHVESKIERNEVEIRHDSFGTQHIFREPVMKR